MATADMKKRLEQVETRLNSVETRLGSVETRLGSVETRLGGVETRLGSVETNLVQLATKVDALPTKNDIAVFTSEVKDQFGIMVADCTDSVRKAAEGYGASLTKIERELGDLNAKVHTQLADHVKILANHHERISALERR